MRFVRLVVLVVGLVLGAMPSWAAALSAADRAAIGDVVARELAALRRDDDKAAFALIDKDMRGFFANDPVALLALVRGSYPALHRPRAMRIAEITEVAGKPVQRVELVGEDSRWATAMFWMARQRDGTWRIAAIGFAYMPPDGA